MSKKFVIHLRYGTGSGMIFPALPGRKRDPDSGITTLRISVLSRLENELYFYSCIIIFILMPELSTVVLSLPEKFIPHV